MNSATTPRKVTQGSLTSMATGSIPPDHSTRLLLGDLHGHIRYNDDRVFPAFFKTEKVDNQKLDHARSAVKYTSHLQKIEEARDEKQMYRPLVCQMVNLHIAVCDVAFYSESIHWNYFQCR
jgi:hypothetical protein